MNWVFLILIYLPLSKIKSSFIKSSEKQISIKIPNRLKTSGKNKMQPLLEIPLCVELPRVCVASTVTEYLKKTHDLRSLRYDNLIIITKKPYTPATTQIISRWVKETLNQSDIDTSIFSAHSTRHAATSAATLEGLNVELFGKCPVGRKDLKWLLTFTIFPRLKRKILYQRCYPGLKQFQNLSSNFIVKIHNKKKKKTRKVNLKL